MKKIIVGALLMFIGTSAFSQGLDLNLGVKGGGNFSNLRYLDQLNLEGRVGFHAGIFLGLKLSGKFGLQADALYSQQGAKFSADAGDFDLNYVNLPIVLKYYLVEDEGLNVQIGGQYGFLISDKINAVVGDVQYNVKANDSDVEGIIGLGYEFLDKVQIEARFHLGFTEVTEDKRANGMHKYISLGFGYSFF